jgi:hypothetical protein
MSQTPFDISVSRELVYSFNVPIVWVWYGSYTDIFISPLLQHQYVVRQRNREYSLTVCVVQARGLFLKTQESHHNKVMDIDIKGKGKVHPLYRH